MILVFDVGNTETTIGLFDDETLRGHWRIISGVERTADEFSVLLRGLLSLDGFEQTIVRFTTDIPHLTNWGVALLIGPGSILVAHTEHERVAKSELLRAVEIYADLARTLLVREEITTGAAR